MATAKPGLVLVFDLDQTLIDTNNDWSGIIDSLQDESLTDEQFKEIINTKIVPLLNMTLIEKVLRPASVLRKTKKVAAIFMLTNNTQLEFAANVSYAIQELLKVVSKYHDGKIGRHTYFFDYIMLRNHASRNRSKNPNNPPKSITDVETMLQKIGLPTENLEGRTYFFDDIADHKIRNDFKRVGLNDKDHYIHILPGNGELEGGVIKHSGFSRGFPDPTDYSPVERAFAEAAAPVAAPNAAGGSVAAPVAAPVAANIVSLPPPCQGSSCSIQGGGRRRYKKTRRAYKKSKAGKKSRRRLYSLLCKKLNP
jgi:hypothetical protein